MSDVSSLLRRLRASAQPPTLGGPRGFLPVRLALVILAVHLTGALIPWLVSVYGGYAGASPWAHWDAVYYVRLATDGYGPYVHGADHTGLAFLPLYPLLLSPLIHLGLPPYGAAIVLSQLCALVAYIALVVLVARDVDTGTALRALILLAATPAALFLNLGYSESLYLALSVWGFVLLRRQRWLGAAILFAFAVATRPTGAILALPYLMEWVGHHRSTLRAGPGASMRALLPLALLAVPLALVGAYDASQGASPLAYLVTEHAAWHHTWAWPWATIWGQVMALPTLHGAGSSLMFTALLNLGAVVAAIPLAVVAARRLPASYTVYALAIVVMATAADSRMPFYGPDVSHPYMMPLVSAHRYLLVAFPLAVGTAMVLRRRGVMLITTLLLLLQVALAALFVHGIWAG